MLQIKDPDLANMHESDFIHRSSPTDFNGHKMLQDQALDI